MNELLILPALLSAALMVGNEFTVGAFINPAYGRLPEQAQAYAARETARVFGRVMPFWMPANLILNILLVFPFGERYSASWWFYLTAAVLFAVVIVFSLVFPVPINNRIAAWDPEDLPNDWRELRRRWDKFHSVRIVLLLSALGCLIWGTVKY
jgi:uncharacterized membrane protein